MHTASRKRLQIKADLITLICVFCFIVLIAMLSNPHLGAAALGLIFPMLFVGLLHLILGPVAISAAIATKRFGRNSWIFGYYLFFLLAVLSYTGIFRSISHYVSERWERSEHASEYALYVAIEQGHTQEVARLLETGADPAYCFESIRDYRLHSPLQYAIELGFWERTRHRQEAANLPRIVSILLDHGADPNGACIDQNGYAGLPPVLLALRKPDAQILDLLLHSGADLDPLPNYSALVMAIAGNNYRFPNDSFEARNHRKRLDGRKVYPVIAQLLEAGADVNGLQYGVTPLHWAVVVGDLRLVDQLLAAGADPDIKDPSGRSSVDWSIDTDVPEIRKRLESHKHLPPS